MESDANTIQRHPFLSGADTWKDAVRARVRDHPFVAPAHGTHSLENFLASLLRQHGERPEFAFVPPPLPGLPMMPLDDRWVELRVVEDRENTLKTAFGGAFLPGVALSVQRLLNTGNSLIVVGPPGSGKTTILKWAALYLIRETRSSSLLPLYVPLRNFVRWQRRHPGAEHPVYAYLASQHGFRSDSARERFIDFLLDIEGGVGGLRNLCLLLLDGWDEVSEQERDDLREEIERFHYFMPTILTSRPSGFARSLPITTVYEVAPLSFDSMRSLMREWFSRASRPEWEPILVDHLDRHRGLRELARNPFVLTLLCAVVAQHASENVPHATLLPATRSQLYEQAVNLFARFCDTSFGDEGYPFTEDTLRRAEAAALTLLERRPSPYEFTPSDINRAVQGDNLLHNTLERARLINLVRQEGRAYNFLHATLHEYLAAQELRRRLRGGRVDVGHLLTESPIWLQVLLFVFGLERNAKTTPELWLALKESLTSADRFGLRWLQIGRILADANVTDGGTWLLGTDVRERLWDLLIRSPDVRPYLEVLVELDQDYIVSKTIHLTQSGTDRFALVFQLFDCLPPKHPRRGEVADYMTVMRLRTADDPFWSSPVGRYLDRESIEPSNLRSAGGVRPPEELIQMLSETEVPSAAKKRLYYKHLARSRTKEAELFLARALSRASESEEVVELADILATLGTLAVRDALVARLQLDSAVAASAEALLRALYDMPLDRMAANAVLACLEPDHPMPVRVAAAQALGRCIDDAPLNRLTDYIRSGETDSAVREAALDALARSGSVTAVKHLYREGMTHQDGPERRAAWRYLLSIAHRTPPGYDQGQVLPMIRSMVGLELEAPEAADLSVVEQAYLLEAVNAGVLDRVRGILRDRSMTLPFRVAACRGVHAAGQAQDNSLFQHVLNEARESPAQEELAKAAALALAFRSPETLTGSTDPLIEQALWRMSLDSGKMIVGRRVIDPEKPLRKRIMRTKRRFKVALTFPGEHRDYIKEVADHLIAQLGRDAVFYDNNFTAELARPDLDTYLQDIYRNQSDLIVPFFCKEYDHKQWCRIEWRSIREILQERTDDIMLMRFDDAPVRGSITLDGYVDLQHHTPKEAADLILERLQMNSSGKRRRTTPKATVTIAVPAATTPAVLSDEVWNRLTDIAARLYARGPSERHVWTRAGGDLSTLDLAVDGRTAWYAALQVLRNGGGGAKISLTSLVTAMREDYSGNPDLAKISGA